MDKMAALRNPPRLTNLINNKGKKKMKLFLISTSIRSRRH